MNRADCKTLRSAALELDKWLKAIQDDLYPVEARKYPKLIKRLRQIANAEQKQIKQDREAREFQAAYDEGDIE